jgi:hypothetical protein
MPKHRSLVKSPLPISAILAFLVSLTPAEAGDKGLGLLLSVTNLFRCADADMVTAEGACRKRPDHDSLTIGVVRIVGVACNSPADVAGVKRDDVVVSINGVAVNGLTQDAYEDLLEMAAGGEGSWVVLRKSFGQWERKELTLHPAELDDDFSCGKPDSETRLQTGEGVAVGLLSVK